MIQWLFLFAFLYGQLSFAQAQCGLKNNPEGIIKLSAKDQCENIKKSTDCQNLYKKMKEDGTEPSEKALRCEVDSELTKSETLAISYIACLKGGVEGGIIAPVKKLGEWLGETTAKAVISLQKDSERQKFCDQHPEQKEKIYSSFNNSVPRLLRLEIPKDLAKKSCAQIEADIYHAKKFKERLVADKVDFKQLQKNPILNAEEKEYLDYKYKNSNFASTNDQGLLAMADQALKDYNIAIQCYNLEARSYLRCEALFQIATLGIGAGKTVLSVLSGLKVERFTQAAKALTLESGTGSLKGISEAEKLKLLTSAKNLSKSERVKAAEKLLGKQEELSKAQQNAILEAHKVPLNNLKEKARILKGKDLKPGEKPLFTTEERSVLMRTGITGEFDDYIKVSNLAAAAEQSAYNSMEKLERTKTELLRLKEKGQLPQSKLDEIEKSLADIDAQLIEQREKLIVGDVIAPGAGPADLARLDRRVGYTSRELEIAELNQGRTAPLLERRAKLLKETGEFKAMAKDYSSATKAYNLAAGDVVKALESGGLTKYEDQIQALRILGNADSNQFSEAYQTLASKIARSPQVQNRVIDPSKIELSPPAVNPVVSNQQKNSTWEAIREFRDQNMRIEIQRARFEDTLGHSWDRNQRANDTFEAMIQRREELKNKVEERLMKEMGSSSANKAQQILRQLDIQ